MLLTTSNLLTHQSLASGILEGFFWIFDDYERPPAVLCLPALIFVYVQHTRHISYLRREFSGKPREQLKKGNKAFDALEAWGCC